MNDPGVSTYDLTLAQNQIWLSQKVLGSTTIFNLTVAYYLPGEIDADIFTRAFNQLVSESDCFRLELKEVKGKVVQTFLPEKHIPVEIIDFRDQPDPKAAFNAWGDEHAKISIDFDNLFVKCALVYVNSSGAYWAFVAHHLLFDGWGSFIHYQRLLTIYQELASGNAIQSPPCRPCNTCYPPIERIATRRLFKKTTGIGLRNSGRLRAAPNYMGGPLREFRASVYAINFHCLLRSSKNYVTCWKIRTSQDEP